MSKISKQSQNSPPLHMKKQKKKLSKIKKKKKLLVPNQQNMPPKKSIQKVSNKIASKGPKKPMGNKKNNSKENAAKPKKTKEQKVNVDHSYNFNASIIDVFYRKRIRFLILYQFPRTTMKMILPFLMMISSSLQITRTLLPF